MTKSPITEQFRRFGSEVPFGELSITLLLFTHRLHRQLRFHGASEVSFLAREGLFLKELFDTYQQIAVPPKDHIPSRYLLVSRRALYAPSLPSGTNSFRFLLEQYPDISAQDFVGSLGMSDEHIIRLESKGSDATPATIDDLVRSGQFQSLFASHREEQRSLIHRYLQPALAAAGDRLHVVDVGWKGSMQDFLGSIVGDTHDISGWYLGLGTNATSGTAGSTKNGVIFDIGPPKSQFFNIFAHFKSLYEALLNADHASIVGYTENNGTVAAILDPRTDEVNQHHRLVLPLQERLMSVFVAMCKTVGPNLADSPRTQRCVAQHHARMIFRPRKVEVALIDELLHYENFGEIAMVHRGDHQRQRVALTRSAARLLLDRRSLYGGSWPPLELKRQGLGLLIRPIGTFRSIRELRSITQ